MDREQIKADIVWFEQELSKVADCYEDPDYDAGVMRRAIARLRADLAKMDGPAEGFGRLYLICDAEGAIMCWSTIEAARRDAASYAAHGGAVAIVSADIPISRVVEVDGTVEVVR